MEFKWRADWIKERAECRGRERERSCERKWNLLAFVSAWPPRVYLWSARKDGGKILRRSESRKEDNRKCVRGKVWEKRDGKNIFQEHATFFWDCREIITFEQLSWRINRIIIITFRRSTSWDFVTLWWMIIKGEIKFVNYMQIKLSYSRKGYSWSAKTWNLCTSKYNFARSEIKLVRSINKWSHSRKGYLWPAKTWGLRCVSENKNSSMLFYQQRNWTDY